MLSINAFDLGHEFQGRLGQQVLLTSALSVSHQDDMNRSAEFQAMTHSLDWLTSVCLAKACLTLTKFTFVHIQRRISGKLLTYT